MTNYSELSYPELQKLAEEKGLPYHKVAKDELIRSLEENEAKAENATEKANPSAPQNDSTNPNSENTDTIISRENAKDNTNIEARQEDETDTEENAAEDVAEDETKKNKANTAFVYNTGNHLVRTFDVETHGKKFEKLANEFADNHGHVVSVKFVPQAKICKNCGARMDE